MPDRRRIETRIKRITNGLLEEPLLPVEMPERQTLAVKMRQLYTPGVSIAVINDFQIEWARGFGIAEAGKRKRVSTSTLFQAGSISKTVTAAAVLRLVAEGKFDLDENVNRYLKSWKIPANRSWRPRVTLRQLMSHTAGMNVHGFSGYPLNGKLPTLIQVLNGKAPANSPPVRVNAIPGVEFRYSGGGTSVIQQILVDVLGKPFPKLMHELVLSPLGMKNSNFKQPLPPAWATRTATAHPNDRIPLSGRFHIYPEMAAAGLWTTPSDLALFAIELQLSLLGRSNKLLPSELTIEMMSPQVEDHVGLGVFLQGKDDSTRFGHSGWDEGFVAHMTAYRSQGYGAVVMLNSNRGEPLLGEIMRSIAAEYGWSDFTPMAPTLSRLDAGHLDPLAGRYELKPDFHLDISVTKNKLLIKPTGQAALPFYPQSETNFFARAINAEITFLRSDTGEVNELTFKQNGKAFSGRRTIATISKHHSAK